MATSSQAKPITLNDQTTVNYSRARRTLNRFLRHRVAVVGLVVLIAIVLFVTFGALWYSEADANYNDTKRSLLAPNAEFPLGTDTIGRNILARIIYGGQISMLIGVTAVTVSVLVGTTVGVFSGYFGGVVDSLLMRFTEAMLSIPSLLLLLVMAKFFSGRIPQQEFLGRTFSGSVIVIVVIIGLTSWMYLARIVRSAVLSIRETEYVMAAQALGATHRRIILAHILPNTLAPVIVAATLGVASAILSEAYISFLGVGVQPPTATWGNMLEGSRRYIDDAPWLWIFPGLMIVLTVMSINFVGDGLRDALDPRSDKKI
ncbi:MAG: peptide ABC transporter permease [Chloroflexota bacterium]|nr:MAG: peptide ABC transporter permease [Chloroflexota bacterium]